MHQPMINKFRFVLLFLLMISGAWLAQPAQGQGEPCTGLSGAPLTDCQTLVTFYNATGGSGWTNKTNWLANNQFCTWYGISCTGDRATGINLPANGVTGTLPPTISNLTALTLLSLQNNQIGGTIPSELGALPAIKEINFYINRLTGTIPPQLGNATTLIDIKMGSNLLTGTIPPELGNLVNITELGVFNNQLSGTIPPELGNLAQLGWLNLKQNQLTGTIPPSLGGLSQLWRLWLDTNRLSGALPAELSGLSSLREFSVVNNALTGPIPTSYTSLTGLTATDLGYNGLTASDSGLVSFLNSKDPDWAQTQTVAPGNVQATPLSGNSVQVTWTPIPYTGDGGYYEVGFATAAAGPFTAHGVTANKSASSYTVSGLTANTTYYFAVRTHTPAHGSQANAITSGYSAAAAATTSGFSCNDVSQIPTAECEALVTLYNSTTGVNWTNKTGWLATNTPCTTPWYGIKCSGGRVSEIQLATNNLKGSIPAAIGSFPGLTSLGLRANQLSGPLPPQIGNLTALTQLTLGENQLTGEIPATIGSLVNLEQFWLHYNQLSGPIPTAMGNLTKLKRFGAIDNRLSGEIPAQLLNLTTLTELYLNRNLLSGAIPAQISNLVNLNTLQLANNQFSGDIPPSLASLGKLTSLSLSYNRLTATDAALITFLNAKHPTWADTQTVAPTNLQAAAQSSFAVQLTWTPIRYTADGGYYEVSSATTPGGPYTVKGVTANKSTGSFTVSGLLPSTTYYFVVRTYTPAANVQKSALWSSYTAAVAATTQAETTQTAPTITSTPVTTALRGQPYAYSVVASGSAPLAFLLVTGPAGMGVNSATGLVSWTPSTPGTFAVAVRVSNSVGSAEQPFTITVNELPQITSSPVTAGLVGQPYAYDVDASGVPAPTFALVTNPAGMTINAGSGLLAWTPPAAGIYTVTVTANNSVGADSQTFEINVTADTELEAPQILTQPPTVGAVGQNYTYDVDASGVPAPLFALSQAPAGMSINSTTGSISWLPRDPGVFPVTVTASNSAGATEQSFSITVDAPPAGDAYENDNLCAEATLIPTNGGKQQHTFHVATDTDWLRFEAEAFKTYIVEVTNLGPSADAIVQLHNACDQAPADLANNAFGRSVRLEWDSLRNGDYYLELSQFDGESFGPQTLYEIAVTVDNTPPSAPQSPRCTALNDRTLAIQWKQSPERDVKGYRIAFTGNNNSGNEDVAGATTTYYELGGLTPNQRYAMTVNAIDHSRNESPPSGVVQCLVTQPVDSIPPVMNLTQPLAGTFYTTTAFSLTFTGLATDDTNLARAQVKNQTRNQEGWDYSLSGVQADFRVKDIGLAIGDNQVQVSVFDDAGNVQPRNLVVRRLGEVQGAVLIVAGHNETFGLQSNIYNAANRAYRIFRSAGFSPDNIQFLAPVGQDADGDGTIDTDGLSTPAEIEAALTDWATPLLGPDKPFYLYLIDHGFEEKFCAAGCNAAGAVTPADLDGWLRTLEAATGVDEVTIVIEACQSGSFIDRFNGDVANSLSKVGRVVITSTDRENNAYASAQGAYFSDAFFSCLADSNTLKVCFDQAVEAVEATGVNQVPWLDDNADGIYNPSDGQIARQRVLTRFFSSIRPVISEVRLDRNGANGVLSATVQEGAEDVELVWAAVYPPSFSEPDDVTLNLNVPTVRLEPVPNQPGRYTFSYVNGFTEDGDYRIVFYAQDRLGIHATPRREGQLEQLFLPVVLR
jgi:Leucine-rich repeat (LRR) protein